MGQLAHFRQQRGLRLGADGRAGLVDLDVMVVFFVDDADVGARLAFDPDKGCFDPQRRQAIAEQLAAAPSGEGQGDARRAERAQHARDVESFAAVINLPRRRTQYRVEGEVGNGQLPVYRRVKGDGVDHTRSLPAEYTYQRAIPTPASAVKATVASRSPRL